MWTFYDVDNGFGRGIYGNLSTTFGRTGAAGFYSNNPGDPLAFVESGFSQYSPGVNTAVNVAARHTSSDVNAAYEGTADTANTNPTALFAMDTLAMDLGLTAGSAIISQFRLWENDGLTDTQLQKVTANTDYHVEGQDPEVIVDFLNNFYWRS